MAARSPQDRTVSVHATPTLQNHAPTSARSYSEPQGLNSGSTPIAQAITPSSPGVTVTPQKPSTSKSYHTGPVGTKPGFTWSQFWEDISLRSVLNWTLKILGVVFALLFGIWAPLSFRASQDGNRDNNEAQQQLMQKLTDLEDVADTRKMQSILDDIALLRVWEFCDGREDDLRACNVLMEAGTSSINELVSSIARLGPTSTAGSTPSQPTRTSSPSSNGSLGANPGRGGLDKGLDAVSIIGIVVSVFGLFVAVLAASAAILRMRKKKRRELGEENGRGK